MKKCRLACLLPGLILMILLAGCGGGGGDSVAVYTAGYYHDGSKDIACFWTGTAPTPLLGDGSHNAFATDIEVYDGTVYTSGRWHDGVSFIPCYWVGTARHDLERIENYDAYVTLLNYAGGTVYTAGRANDLPCYWEGSTRYPLAMGAGGTRGSALSIKVAEGIVCICGHYFNGVKDVACYWIGGSA